MTDQREKSERPRPNDPAENSDDDSDDVYGDDRMILHAYVANELVDNLKSIL